MAKPRHTDSKDLPATSGWRLKGDGVAYTTSREIINSRAGRDLLEKASKVTLVKSKK